MSEGVSQVPGTREEIFEQTDASAQVVYQTIRDIVDDLDEAAPWGELYCPPESDTDFLEMENRLLSVIEGIPARIQKMFEALENTDTEESLPAGKLAEFFDNTFLIISRDRDRLTHGLKQLSGQDLNRGRRNFICDLSADLKGKYQSALMGVCGRVIARERWSTVEIEPLLFPEKREEFERNLQLVDALRSTLAMIRNLAQEMPLAEFVREWKEERRIDQYALVDLTMIVGAIGQLLKQNSRRALYSGDYHNILERERTLAERVRKLQIMHASTWTEETQISSRALFRRLMDLSVEVAALLDAEILVALIGQSRFAEIKKRAQDLGDRDPLVELFRHGNLRVFLEDLLGHVLKRESLSANTIQHRRKWATEERSPFEDAKLRYDRLTDPSNDAWRAFVAATTDSQKQPVLAIEFKRELERTLIPQLMEVDTLRQFGKVLKTTCASISSINDQQPIQTVMRLLGRLHTAFQAGV